MTKLLYPKPTRQVQESIARKSGMAVLTSDDIKTWDQDRLIRLFNELDIKKTTIEGYANGIKWYLNWLNEQGIRFWEAKVEDVAEYKRYLINRDLSVPTKQIYFASVRAFYRVVARYGIANPADNVAPVRDESPEVNRKDGITIDQWRSILAGIDTRKYNGKKHYLLIFMLFSTGVRQMSLLNLRWRDFAYRPGVGLEMEVKLKSHHSKTGRIILNDECVRLLEEFKYVYQQQYCRGYYNEMSDIDGNWYVFGIKDRMPNRRSFFKAIKIHMDKAGVWQKHQITAHSIRHGLAEYLIEKGHPIRYVQMQLCHSDIKTTEIYCQKIERKKMVLEMQPVLNQITSVKDTEKKKKSPLFTPKIVQKTDDFISENDTNSPGNDLKLEDFIGFGAF